MSVRRSKARAGAVLLLLGLFGAEVRAAVCVVAQGTPFSISDTTSTSSVVVSGLPGAPTDVEVRLIDVATDNNSSVNEIDILLVGPLGDEIILFSFVCEDDEGGPFDWSFSRFGTAPLPKAFTAGVCASGTYLESDQSGGFYLLEENPPAPAPPYPDRLADLRSRNPNGSWTLYGAALGGSGSQYGIGSWELRITATACTGGNPNQLFVDDFEIGTACDWSATTGASPPCP